MLPEGAEGNVSGAREVGKSNEKAVFAGFVFSFLRDWF
jgi:hypothetical protein